MITDDYDRQYGKSEWMKLDIIQDLLREMIDELREKNGKGKKYHMDKTEFSLGA